MNHDRMAGESRMEGKEWGGKSANGRGTHGQPAARPALPAAAQEKKRVKGGVRQHGPMGFPDLDLDLDLRFILPPPSCTPTISRSCIKLCKPCIVLNCNKSCPGMTCAGTAARLFFGIALDMDSPILSRKRPCYSS